jgi:hypothetical protein
MVRKKERPDVGSIPKAAVPLPRFEAGEGGERSVSAGRRVRVCKHRRWEPSPSRRFASGPSLSRDEARERD